MKEKDQRVKIMNEILQGIKVGSINSSFNVSVWMVYSLVVRARGVVSLNPEACT